MEKRFYLGLQFRGLEAIHGGDSIATGDRHDDRSRKQISLILNHEQEANKGTQ